MSNKETLKYSAFQRILVQIQSVHPEWTVRVENMFKVFNGELPPDGYFDDFVPQALIRSENKEWRAWLIPSTDKKIDDYIPLEYQNVLHVHAPLELSKPLDELLTTDAGIKEFIRKTNRDILCKLPDSSEFEKFPNKLIETLEKIPHFDTLAQLNERIEIIDEDLCNIQYYIVNCAQTKNLRKHILQLLFIVIDNIGKIVQTPPNITQIKRLCNNNERNKSNKPHNTFVKGLPKSLQKQEREYWEMRNNLIHDSMWYDTAIISPSNPKDLFDFYERVKNHWEELKEVHKLNNKPLSFCVD